ANITPPEPTTEASTDDSTIRALLPNLASGDDELIEETVKRLAKTGDSRLARFFELYRQGSVYNWPDDDGNVRIVVNEETEEDDDLNEFAPLLDPLTGKAILIEGKQAKPDVFDLEDISPGRKLRKLVNSSKFLLRLFSPDLEMRMSGAKKCGDPPYNADALPFLDEIVDTDDDPKIRWVANESILLTRLAGKDPDNPTFADRVKAIRKLSEIESLRALPRVEDFLKKLKEGDEEFADVSTPERVKATKVSEAAMERIGDHQTFVDRVGNAFRGVSYGSVLILMALGLAITFGLMGVINMAHGELMMIGAYATYEIMMLFTAGNTYTYCTPILFAAAFGCLGLSHFHDKWPSYLGAIACLVLAFSWRAFLPDPSSSQWVQHSWLFRERVIHLSPEAFDYYYLVALFVAFVAAACVGWIMEWLVVRHLYNRPLESLLATWGVGLILIQLARVQYGDNIGVNAPTWARGGWEVSQDIIFPYARLYLLGLCTACVGFVYFIMKRTKQGMLMRATMQNRDMAESLGVRTRNVDRFTFALGSGIAGVAGYGWTIIGGVTPDMGQTNFIVDSFLVVVTGGVGELAGVICSGLGIGAITKMIEPIEFGDFLVGPVWAKVILLALIVAFIQFRPSGLFAPKGRAADD
ncbi:MAG: urea ABC transporter permease subunit UrtB, partial [Opitutales bacterium]